MIVQMLFGEADVLDRRRPHARLEVRELVDPNPAHASQAANFVVT